MKMFESRRSALSDVEDPVFDLSKIEVGVEQKS